MPDKQAMTTINPEREVPDPESSLAIKKYILLES